MMRQFSFWMVGLTWVTGGFLGEVAIAQTAPASILAQTQGNLTPAMLKNATYQIPDQGSFTLSNGVYQSGSTKLTLTRKMAIADVTGDGVQDAAAILALETGGSATFIYLAVMASQGGKPANLETLLLGDRVRVQSLTIKDGQVRVQMLKHQSTDPQCCPTNLVTEVYRIDNTLGKLAPMTLSESQKQQIYVEDTPLPLIDQIGNDNAPYQPELGEIQIKF